MQLFRNIMLRAGNGKGWLIADQMVFSGASFVTTVLMARILGPVLFGLFSAIILLLYLLLSVCVSFVLQPLQVQLAATENKGVYITAVFYIQLFITGLLLFLIWLILQTDFDFAAQVRPYTFPLLMLAGTFLLQDFCRRVFIAQEEAKNAFITDAVSAGLQFVFLGVLLFSGKADLYGSLLAIGATSIPAIVVAVRLLRIGRPVRTTIRNVALSHWQQGRWLMLTAVLQWWAGNFILALSGVFLGIRALGALRLAQTILGLLSVLFQMMENHAVPRAAFLLQQSSQAFKKYLGSISRNGLLLLIPVLLLLFIFPSFVFRLCGGEEYTPYAYALRGMALLNIFIFAGYPLRIAIRVLLMNRAFFTAYLISFLFTMITAEYIVSRWQLTGVIAALICNQVIILGYWYWMLARKQFYVWK